MEAPPDLIIPIRLDPAGATAGLNALGGAGKKAGDDINAAGKKAASGVKNLDDGAAGAKVTLLALGAAQFGLSAIKGAASAIGSEFKRAADHVKSLAEDFATLRRVMQELAALSDQPITDKFVLEQAAVAQKYGMTMQENQAAQEAFKNVAGAQIGDMLDKETGKPTGEVAAGAKLTTEQGDELYGRVAQFMKSVGQKPELGMSLVGAQLQQAKGPQDVDKLMRDFVETYSIAQKGPVDVKQMIPELQGIMARGATGQEAATLFNVVAPVGPSGEAGTSAQRAMSAIMKMKVEGKGKEFGVEDSMKPMEAIKAFSENINKRRDKLLAEGKDEETANVQIEKLLAEKDVVSEEREARGLVRGAAGQGVKLGGFAQYQRILEEVPEDVEEAKKKEFAGTREGRVQAAQIRKEGARIKSGAKKQALQEVMEEAAADVAESGEAEKGSAANAARGAFSGINRVELEQQLVNRQALTNVAGRAAEAGIETQYDPRSAVGRANIGAESLGNQEQVNKRIADLLEKIEANTRKVSATAVVGGAMGAVLSMPPAGGAGARQ